MEDHVSIPILGFRDPITSFRGEHYCLSNFYPLPTPIIYNGIGYQTSEAAYQSGKTNVYVERVALSRYYDPAMAKRAGRNVTMRVPKAEWEAGLRDEVMLEVLELKFEIPLLRDMLAATGERELVELNLYHDVHFGRCYCKSHAGAGDNMLGRLLAMLRGRLA